MSLKGIIGDIFSLPRRSFRRELEILPRNNNEKEPDVVQESCWASLPPELLRCIIQTLEDDESSWPSRKHVVACASVCRPWRELCRDIVLNPEVSGKLTFPESLKQPGPRDDMILCYIKRDKSQSTYRLYLSLTSDVLVENGKFLMSAKRVRKGTRMDFRISMDPKNSSRSSCSYLGSIRSNFLGRSFMIFDTQPPPSGVSIPSSGCRTRKHFFGKRAVPENYNIAQVKYELNILGARGPRRMNVTLHTIPFSSLQPGGTVPGQPDQRALLQPEESFRSSTTMSTTSAVATSTECSSSHFSDITGGSNVGENGAGVGEQPLVLKNKAPRWHEQLQCWCLNFRGRVTVASVKNFQLIAAAAAPPPAAAAPPPDQDKVILQFGKVAKDTFTMDFRYPLSAFQAFAICLSSFDTKLACE